VGERTVIAEYAQAFDEPEAPQGFFMLAQDAIDELAGRNGLILKDPAAAGPIGIIAALMDLRLSVDQLAKALRDNAGQASGLLEEINQEIIELREAVAGEENDLQ
jgi:hypothetical protein